MAENIAECNPALFCGFLYLHHCKNAEPHQKVELKFNFLASCQLEILFMYNVTVNNGF